MIGINCLTPKEAHSGVPIVLFLKAVAAGVTRRAYGPVKNIPMCFSGEIGVFLERKIVFLASNL